MGARDRLAELHCPGNPPLEMVQFVPKQIKPAYAADFAKILLAVMDYDPRMATKTDRRSIALPLVLKQYEPDMDASTFDRHRKRIHAHLARVRGEDITRNRQR
jgi:hypothetical protein